jgi:hypothetical protein
VEGYARRIAGPSAPSARDYKCGLRGENPSLIAWVGVDGVVEQVIYKTEIAKRGYIESTKLERTILCEAVHPFIVRLRFAFQNTIKLYLVTGEDKIGPGS